MSKSSLGHVPGDKWEFDESVAECFPDMLRRSIPDYANMREHVLQVAGRFVDGHGDFLDLGASLGDSTEHFFRMRLAERFFLVEKSPAFVSRLEEKFRGPEAKVIEHDLERGLPLIGFHLACTMAVLTLQFLPLHARARLVRRVFEHTRQRGAMIVVEKVVPDEPQLMALFENEYRIHKASSGYSTEEIDAKEEALRGVMQPMPPCWNEKLLRTAGFEVVEMFWRSMNFCAWIAVKP